MTRTPFKPYFFINKSNSSTWNWSIQKKNDTKSTTDNDNFLSGNYFNSFIEARQQYGKL